MMIIIFYFQINQELTQSGSQKITWSKQSWPPKIKTQNMKLYNKQKTRKKIFNRICAEWRKKYNYSTIPINKINNRL